LLLKAVTKLLKIIPVAIKQVLDRVPPQQQALLFLVFWGLLV
jgi:hypothetical protein